MSEASTLMGGANHPAGGKLLYLVTEDWFFLSHFLERAKAARDAGHRVVVAARMTDGEAAIRAAGLEPRHIAFDRRGTGPLGEGATLAAIARLYRAERPDIVHHVALKPILYGSIAARLAGVKAIVNAPVGMGYLYTSSDARARVLRPLVDLALRRLLNPRGSAVVVENADDRASLVASGLAREADVAVIRGAGVDLDRFRPVERPRRVPGVVLGARMLRSKGVEEFVAAARLLRQRGVPVTMTLVGRPDPQNPQSVDEAELQAWQAEGAVTWLGQRADMDRVLADADIACLPSWREGLPKFLLEAMASGLPIVATDVVGCREAVRHGGNGLLVPPRDPGALADALAALCADAPLRHRLGAAGRLRAEREFSDAVVSRETLQLYETLQCNMEE